MCLAVTVAVAGAGSYREQHISHSQEDPGNSAFGTSVPGHGSRPLCGEGGGGGGRENMTGCGRRRHDMWATRAAQRLLFFVWSHIDCDPTSDLVLLHTCRQQKRWRDRGREPNIRFAHASKSVSPTSLSLPLTRARWRPPHTNSSTMIVMKSNLGGCQRTHMHASKDPVMARMHATFPKQTDRISAAVRWHWRAIHFPHSQILLHGAGMLLRHVAGAGT